MQVQNFQNAMVSYKNDTLMVGGLNDSVWKDNALSGSYNSYSTLWSDFHTCYPSYTYHWHHDEPNKTEQAFKIVGKLIEKKLIKKEMTVAKFIETVNEVASVL